VNETQAGWRKIRSISVAIALLTLIGGVVFALIIASVSYWIQRKGDIRDLEIRAQQTSDQLNYIAEVLLNKGDLNSVQRIVENVSTDRGILFIVIIDASLKILASSQHDLLRLPISEYKSDPEFLAEFRQVITHHKTTFFHHPELGHFEIIAPITLPHGSRTQPLSVGAVNIVFRDDPLIWNPRRNFWRHLQLSLVLTAFGIAILYGVLRRWVTSPLEQLTRASERLGSGDLGIQIPVSSSNEIGRLAATFNAMSASLAKQRRAIQASEERYLQVFHSSPACLIVVDAAGIIADVNATFLEEVGEPNGRSAWIGKSVTEVPFIQLGKLEREMRDLLKYAAPAKRWKVSIPLRGRGSPSFFNFSAAPLFDSDKAVTGAVIALENITTEQTLETQLIQSQKMESLGVLAGGVAHDFNNILTGILGYSSLLKRRLPAGDPTLPAVEVIEKSGLRAKALIQQMMGFARRTASIKMTVEVNSLVSEIVLLLEKGMMGQEGLIQVDLDPACPKIWADSGQIHQAVMNLCLNAKDALPPEGGTIFLKTRKRRLPSRFDPSSEEAWVEITVQDTGSGIEPDLLPRIFEPFFTTKEIGKGTGLGLSVTYGIIKEHGGELTVQSEIGKGTIFAIVLPSMENDAGKELGEGPEIVLKGRRRKILLIDDEAVLLEMGKKILEEREFQVLTAEGGEAGIEIYRQQSDKISLVVLDLLMPGMGGSKTYAQLREINPQVKVLLTSGYSGNQEFVAHIGNPPFLKKPYRVEEFLHFVKKALT